MRIVLFHIVFLCFLWSCSSERATSELKNPSQISIDCKFNAALYSNKQVVNRETTALIEPLNGGFRLTTKKKSTLFGKKRIDFFWVQTDSVEQIFNKFSAVQKALRAQNLIGFESNITTIQFRDTLVRVFFQEGIDKKLIESNKNREGVLFSLQGEEFSVLYSPKKTTSQKIVKLKTTLNSYLNGNLPLKCYFDWGKSVQVFSTVEAMGLLKYKGLKLHYYANPVSNLIEPLISFSPQVDFDTLKEKTFSAKQFSSSLSFTEAMKLDVQRCFHKNKWKLPNIKIIEGRSEILDSSAVCYPTDVFFEYFEKTKEVYRLKVVKTNISKSLIIPKGVRVEFKQGEEVDFTNGGFILSFSPVSIDGAKFHSSDSTGRGFHVINARQTSKVSNSQFLGLSNLEFDSWSLPSAVTFFESPVQIERSSFLNNKSEDGLNLFRCFPFLLDECVFQNTFSDAFDADFSDGLIKNCVFKQLGNDGVDVSGSSIRIQGCVFEEVADKALSAGEASSMLVDSISINGASLAVTAKDNSTIKISNSLISNSEVAFCAFQKKKEFGPSHIEGQNVLYENSKKDFLIEKKSSLKLNGNSIEEYEESVREILYGNEYGKATVK